MKHPRSLRSRPHTRGLAAIASLLVLLSPLAATSASVAASASTGLRPLGVLEASKSSEETNGATYVASLIGVIPGTRTLVGEAATNGGDLFVHLFDLTQRVPRPSGIFDLKLHAAPDPRQFAFDATRNRMYFIDLDSHSQTQVQVVDMRTWRAVGAWALPPAFDAAGLTYAPQDDRVYVVGEWDGNYLLGPDESASGVGGYPFIPSGVVELDPNDGAVVWQRPVTQCQYPLVTQAVGGVIVRSTIHQALYFACERPDTYAGMSGLVRLWIDPKASQSTALQFPVEFFPISGIYQGFGPESVPNGVMDFDPATDRVFLQSTSSLSPGAWEFDGRLSAWVGQISAPYAPTALGVSPLTGHVYMSTSTAVGGFMVVADGRATPAPQGDQFAVSSARPLIVTDPLSRRIFFLAPDLGALGLGAKGESGWIAAADDEPDATPERPAPYDSITTDVPEGPNTFATFAGSTSGYGTRAIVVGGYGGALGGATGKIAVTQGTELLGVEPGDRGLTFASVPSVDLRNVGATALASAVAPDTLTANDLITQQGTVQQPPSQLEGSSIAAGQTHGNPQTHDALEHGGQAIDQNVDPKHNLDPASQPTQQEVASALDWPWPDATCSDGGGKANGMTRPSDPLGQHEDGNKGSPGFLVGVATVSCDLGNADSEAEASSGRFEVDLPGGGTLSVASSRFTATAVRDPALGMVTRVSAEVRGLQLALPTAGTLTIQRIVQRAISKAHGRRGTASLVWTREFSGVRIEDAQGNAVLACPGSSAAGHGCDPQAMLADANALFDSHVRLELPEPLRVETPGGAFAGIQKTASDFYGDLTTNDDGSLAVPALQMLVINDGAQKSRLDLQFAGIQTSSIYGISLAPTSSQGSVTPPLPQVVPPLVNDPPPPSQRLQPVQPGPIGIIPRLFQTSILLLRSPRDGILAALFAAMFVGAAWSIGRRGRLVRVLQER